MADDGFFEAVEGKLWSSSYNQQKRPDGSRVTAVIPKGRLITKQARYFTTDTSTKQLQKNLGKAVQSDEGTKEISVKKFSPKNA